MHASQKALAATRSSETLPLYVIRVKVSLDAGATIRA